MKLVGFSRDTLFGLAQLPTKNLLPVIMDLKKWQRVR